jgi:hypothetical protein
MSKKLDSKKPRETKLDFEILGWGAGYWRSEHTLHIRVTGTGPNGNLRGKVVYSPTGNEWERVRFVGDGRYSFMHGNSSLRTRDGEPEVLGLNRSVIEKLGDKWILDHPNALLDFKIEQAKGTIAKVQAQLDRARNDVDLFKSSLAQKKSALHELQSQQSTQRHQSNKNSQDPQEAL